MLSIFSILLRTIRLSLKAHPVLPSHYTFHPLLSFNPAYSFTSVLPCLRHSIEVLCTKNLHWRVNENCILCHTSIFKAKNWTKSPPPPRSMRKCLERWLLTLQRGICRMSSRRGPPPTSPCAPPGSTPTLSTPTWAAAICITGQVGCYNGLELAWVALVWCYPEVWSSKSRSKGLLDGIARH